MSNQRGDCRQKAQKEAAKKGKAKSQLGARAAGLQVIKDKNDTKAMADRQAFNRSSVPNAL